MGSNMFGKLKPEWTAHGLVHHVEVAVEQAAKSVVKAVKHAVHKDESPDLTVTSKTQTQEVKTTSEVKVVEVKGASQPVDVTPKK